MLTLQYIHAYFGDRIYNEGKAEFDAGNVLDLDISESVRNYIEVKATLQGDDVFEEVHVKLVLDPNENYILITTCSCKQFYHRRICKHVAAVAIAYFYRDVYSPNQSGRKRRTDRRFKQFLDTHQSSLETFDDHALNIILVPYIHPVFNDDEMEVSFKIGLMDERLYSLTSITEFVTAMDDEGFKKYGKSLEFTHKLHAFHPSYRPLVQYIIDYVHDDTSYHYYRQISGGYSSFYRGDLPRKTMSIKSYAIDMFWDTIKELQFKVKDDNATEAKFNLLEHRPPMNAYINEVEDGIQFIPNIIPFISGKKYSYYFDMGNLIVYRDNRASDAFRQLAVHLDTEETNNIFIADEDIPNFTKNLYPVLKKSLNISTDGYDPTKYLPEVPTFEIYLDLPQDNMVVGSVYAIYSHGKYNVYKPNENHSQRDLNYEKGMDNFFSPWFTSFDPANLRMALAEDEDKLYRFLKFGIPEMQEKAEVFISDALKKLKVHSKTNVSIGVSVNHDLLQLHLVSDQIDLKQISEILSKYDTKKKYYRLKNGEFVDLDENIEALVHFKDSMNLSNAQINKGTIDVPAYRAAYLDSLSSDSLLDIQAEENFRRLIRNMKDTSDIEYEIPQEITDILRPYQVKGFRWLYSLKENHLGGLLADEMGLGKTLQIITLLAAWKDRKRTLIVCPSSLVYNWANEFTKFMPDLHHVMITGFAHIRQELIRNSLEDDILITSYDALKRDREVYENMKFSCQIIDEAQYIKNATTLAAQSVKDINSDFRIALTGTPIENRLSELWSIFDFILPGFFGSYKKFRNNFELPIVRDQDELLEQDLQKMVTPFILRRRKKDVLKDLPEKLEEVYYGQLEGEQKDLYDARVQRLKLMLQKQSDQEFKENRIAVLAELTRLRQICCDPQLLYDNYSGNSAKKELCLNIISNAIEEEHKILLFSQFTSMLDSLTNEFDKVGIRYHKLVGSTSQKDRATMVEQFQQDDVPVFCISLKAGGTGLNLTAADIVIHYDPWWNTAVENQASDRAHRIGQKNIVNVYRLIIKDTVEERIIQLQEEKSNLADRILSSDGVSSASFSREDLLNLL